MPQMVEVTWNDAWQDQTARTAKEAEPEHKPHVNHSTGYLVKRNHVGVMVAGCADFKDGEVTFDRCLFVPAGMVVKVRRLR